MEIEGLAFVGTRTRERAATARFAREVLGLEPATGHGLDAEVFDLPDGSRFAVTDVDADEPEERTVGFRVADLDAAVAELRAAGVEVDDVAEGAQQRYVHLRGPDGRLYELVQDLS